MTSLLGLRPKSLDTMNEEGGDIVKYYTAQRELIVEAEGGGW